MGNVLKRNHIKTSAVNHSLSYGLYKKRSKSFSKPKEANVIDLEDNTNMNESDSWTTTIGTLSTPVSLSIPTNDNEQSISEDSTTSKDDCILSSSSYSRRSTTTNRTSNTSADFSSFKNLSKTSEHTTMRLRPDDIEWMNEVQKYQDNEPVFQGCVKDTITQNVSTTKMTSSLSRYGKLQKLTKKINFGKKPINDDSDRKLRSINDKYAITRNPLEKMY